MAFLNMLDAQSAAVLLVNDNAELNKLITKFLAINELVVSTETEQPRAFERVSHKQPALAALNIMPPRMDDLSYFRSVRVPYAGSS